MTRIGQFSGHNHGQIQEAPKKDPEQSFQQGLQSNNETADERQNALTKAVNDRTKIAKANRTQLVQTDNDANQMAFANSAQASNERPILTKIGDNGEKMFVHTLPMLKPPYHSHLIQKSIYNTHISYTCRFCRMHGQTISNFTYFKLCSSLLYFLSIVFHIAQQVF